ncbi:MAG: type II toxin-antitoxin system RelE/ParE family toxin [Tagaea sp.]
MIRSFASAPTRRFYETGKSRFSGPDEETAHLALAALDEAVSLAELGALRSIGLHKLKGDRKGQWAMTISGRWRLCFKFADGDAFEVEIVDYHRG